MAFPSPITWEMFACLGLNQAQVDKLKQFEAIGRHVRLEASLPDISMVTVGQAKSLQSFQKDIEKLIGRNSDARKGADYVREKNAADAAKAADDAHPPQ